MRTEISRATHSAHAARFARFSKLALAVWALLAFLVTGSLASAHLYTLPRPSKVSAALVQALAALRRPEDGHRYSASHVLYAACACSQRIVERLVQRGARSDVSETVLLVGADQSLAERLTRARYRVEIVTPRALRERYDIQAAPLLIISQPDARIAYLGGYTDHKRSLPIRDVELIERVVRGGRSSELPLLGCATGRALQRVLDPFALKYPLSGEDDDVP